MMIAFKHSYSIAQLRKILRLPAAAVFLKVFSVQVVVIRSFLGEKTAWGKNNHAVRSDNLRFP
ncbi:hypothetical protein D3C73_1644030 [compost metagenome]